MLFIPREAHIQPAQKTQQTNDAFSSKPDMDSCYYKRMSSYLVTGSC